MWLVHRKLVYPYFVLWRVNKHLIRRNGGNSNLYDHNGPSLCLNVIDPLYENLFNNAVLLLGTGLTLCNILYFSRPVRVWILGIDIHIISIGFRFGLIILYQSVLFNYRLPTMVPLAPSTVPTQHVMILRV